jgi:hypothetical protein
MPNAQRFSYIAADSAWGEASLMPYAPVTLIVGSREVTEYALVDSGASVNVLPYSLGAQLGLNWEEQETLVRLTGNFARVEAKGISLSARIGDDEPVNLVFVWAKSEDVPFLLGQVNFFMEFDVCFFRSQQAFEVSRK